VGSRARLGERRRAFLAMSCRVGGIDSGVQRVVSTKHLRGHSIGEGTATLSTDHTLGDVHPLLAAHGLALQASSLIFEVFVDVRTNRSSLSRSPSHVPPCT
jgi:hypothetical protein